jgi:hypothetical protein
VSLLNIGAKDCSELFLQTAVRTESRVNQLSMDVGTLTTTSAPKTQINDSQYIGRGQQLLIDDSNDSQKVRKTPRFARPTSILSYTLILPHWLAQYSLQISVCRAAQDWSLNLKPYRTVPRDSKMELAIHRTDFDELRHLIDSGQATVFDRDENGSTALHVCFWTYMPCLTLLISNQMLATSAAFGRSKANSRIARLLLEHGANVHEPDHAGV